MTSMVISGFLVLAGAVAYWGSVRRWFRGWGATAADAERRMSGDAEIPTPNYTPTLALGCGFLRSRWGILLVSIGGTQGRLSPSDTRSQ
jgi:hypothetical protein